MISKRNFAIMTIMMLVLLVMFMATRGIYGNKDEYSINSYYEANPDAIGDWRKMEYFDNELTAYDSSSRTTIFIGDKDSDAYKIVSEWCDYTKGKIKEYPSFSDLEGLNYSEINLIVAGPETIKSSEITAIKNVLAAGKSVLVYELPEEDVLAKNRIYRELFGIQEIVSKNTVISGIKMFSGFLLGGEVIYKPNNEKEEKLQDLELNMPWYQVDNGTKVFMVGLMDNEDIENEQLPPVIWRNYYGNGFIYSVNGDYFSSETGLGIMSGVVNDSKPYYLYPVVNAQNISLVDFPGLSDENQDTLEAIYSRSQNTLCRDVLLPSIISFGRIYEFKMTAYTMVQGDYTDGIYPNTDILDFYYQQFYQNNMEMALSTVSHDDTSLETKISQDADFYESYFSPYQVGALYVEYPENTVLSDKIKNDIYTIVCDNNSSDRILSVSGNATVQRVTSDALNYKYSSDLTMRSIETAIGYSNIKFDFGKIIWPSDEDEHWETASEKMFSVAGTYWQPFYGYSQTTISESDKRVRDYMNLGYAYIGSGNEIRLDMVNSDEGWFMLRTHNQEIDKIEGADYTEFEKDAYLLHVYVDEVNIILKDSGREYNLDY